MPSSQSQRNPQQVRPARANTLSSEKAGRVAETPVTRRAATPVTKREMRAAQRAAYRRRRNTVLSTIAAIVVVVALVFLLKGHLPSGTTSAKGKTATGANAACATTTSGVGPAAAATPPATPPPTSLKPVDDQGIQYIILKQGCGAAVQQGDNVTVNYSGWLASNGSLFDSSLKAGRTPFQVQNVGQAQVISGWNIGLVGMKVGETRRLIIPPAAGYGSQANGPIPANSTLIFDITLVSIDGAATATPAQ